jgi:hypothetical protein
MTALGDVFLGKYLGEQTANFPTIIDPTTGLPIASTNAVIDPSTGFPVSSTNTAIDPTTGLPVTGTQARYNFDLTNTTIDPSTGLPVLSAPLPRGFDPAIYRIDPTTGLPVLSSETPNQKLYSSEAVKWFRKAAELGDTNAMSRLVNGTLPATGLNLDLDSIDMPIDPITGLPIALLTVEESEKIRWTRKLAEAAMSRRWY